MIRLWTFKPKPQLDPEWLQQFGIELSSHINPDFRNFQAQIDLKIIINLLKLA
jgi:hypothetical protein